MSTTRGNELATFTCVGAGLHCIIEGEGTSWSGLLDYRDYLANDLPYHFFGRWSPSVQIAFSPSTHHADPVDTLILWVFPYMTLTCVENLSYNLILRIFGSVGPLSLNEGNNIDCFRSEINSSNMEINSSSSVFTCFGGGCFMTGEVVFFWEVFLGKYFVPEVVCFCF